MKSFLKVFCILAIIGFVLSFIAHFSTYFGVNPQGEFPFVWLLHVGIFVVFVPAVYIMKRVDNGKGIFFHEAVKFAPVWMKILCGVCFLYAAVNFFSFASMTKDGSPDIISGNYVISNHGRIVRVISHDEYEKYRSYEVRGFSGHWMIFYFFSATVLVSQWKKEKIYK